MNEIRAEHDLKPIGKLEDIESPADLPLIDSIINAWSNAKASAQGGEGMEGMGAEGEEGMGDDSSGASQMTADMGQDLDFSDEDLEGMDIEELSNKLKELEAAKSERFSLKKSIELEL